jgi:methionine-rich copper-binding protein CopC
MRLRVFAALPLVVVLLALAAPVSAHARYEGSTPADGERLASPPSEVQADFSEPVTADSYLEVRDPCGAVVSGDSEPVADRITVPMSGTHVGTYTVYYVVQSSVDPHVTDGSFTFTSSGGDPCPGEESLGGGTGGGREEPRGGDGGSDDRGNQTSEGSVDTSDSGTDTTSADATSTETGSGSSGVHDRSNKDRGNKSDAGSERSKGAGDVPLSLQRQERERKGPDPWDLPRDGLVAGLVIAALIGAAGGRIYASIIGPHA